ncbi:MAG: 7-cyano-7-deazaguanine synthase QueC [Gammaproteobacteria bacterium]
MTFAQEHALILLSGGLDSATVLAMAKAHNKRCSALSFYYGQKHDIELKAAQRIAQEANVIEHIIITLDNRSLLGSSLTDGEQSIPHHEECSAIPSTYVPGRNTLFMSYALSIAEQRNIDSIYVGCSAVDYSGYPDCRPEYFNAWQTLAQFANKTGVEGKPITIHTPLLYLTKGETIIEGHRLGIDYSKTISCYQANDNGEACGYCDSCVLRRNGFAAANLPDPTRYRSST